MPGTDSLIHATSTTTGTGNFAITTASGKRAFSDITNSTFYYFISHRTEAEWEFGYTSLLSGELDRASATILNSSNIVSGVASLVNFSAGTKDVTSDIPAQFQSAVYTQDAAPSTPDEDDIWVRTTDMALFIYYNDGNSSQWVELGGGGGGATPFIDSNGNEWLDVSATASAVNYVQITNSATGTGPTIAAAGGDTNADLLLTGKGTGVVKVDGYQPAEVVLTSGSASSVASLELDLSSYSGVFSAYKVILNNVHSASDSVRLRLRSSTDGGTSFDSGASDYQFAYSSADGGSTEANVGQTADNAIRLSNATGNATNECIGAVILTLYDPDNTTDYKYFEYRTGHQDATAGTLTWFYGWGLRVSTADIDALYFDFNSGNIDSVSYTVYGIY